MAEDWTTNKNKSRFSVEKNLIVTRMGDVNSRLDQLDEKVNKIYTELKEKIEKHNNALTSTVRGIKAWIKKWINALKADQKKNQESLEYILARIQLHTSIPPPSHNPPLDPFNTPHPITPKTPEHHNTMPPHEVPFFNVPSISVSPTNEY